MKIRVVVKQPNLLEMCIDQVDEDHEDAVRAVVEKFTRWGEIMHIEFDTEAMTATVVESN